MKSEPKILKSKLEIKKVKVTSEIPKSRHT